MISDHRPSQATFQSPARRLRRNAVSFVQDGYCLWLRTDSEDRSAPTGLSNLLAAASHYPPLYSAHLPHLLRSSVAVYGLQHAPELTRSSRLALCPLLLSLACSRWNACLVHARNELSHRARSERAAGYYHRLPCIFRAYEVYDDELLTLTRRDSHIEIQSLCEH